MIEVKIKAHDKANFDSPSRTKAILHAAGIPVVVDDGFVIDITAPGKLDVEANHEGAVYRWHAVEEVAA